MIKEYLKLIIVTFTAGGITVYGENVVFDADTTKALNSDKTPTGIMESFNNWQATSNNNLQQSTVSTLIRDFIEENNPKLDFDKTFEITGQGQLKFAEGYNPPTPIPDPKTTPQSETETVKQQRANESLDALKKQVSKDRLKVIDLGPIAVNTVGAGLTGLRNLIEERSESPVEQGFESDRQQAALARQALNKEEEKPVEVAKPSLLSKGSDTTRGLKNQNVFNIRDFDQNFNGETGVDEDNFLQFESVELGVRAADRTLTTYGKKHKINTVTGVIERFAPISDNNDTASYIAAVAKQSGFKPEEKIDLSDPQVRAKLLAPMALIESKYKTTPEKILTMLENI